MVQPVWVARDHYALLEVHRDASEHEIKQAFRLQAAAWHPDKFPSADMKARAMTRMEAINRAYAVLQNSDERRRYDLTLPDEEFDLEGDWPEPVQNVGEVWKRLAAFLKDEDLGTSFQRKMAYVAGDCLERRRPISDKQRPYAQAAWEIGKANGFQP